MAQEIIIGRTGSSVYTLRGMWVYRRPINGQPYRYDTLEGFAREWATGAFGPGWRDTPEGKRLIDRFTSH
jgi:hypothetical protein